MFDPTRHCVVMAIGYEKNRASEARLIPCIKHANSDISADQNSFKRLKETRIFGKAGNRDRR